MNFQHTKMKSSTLKKLFFFVMALVIASFVATGIVANLQPSEAEFVVTYLDISPDEAEVGEMVTVSAQVRNTGGEKDTYTATLTVNGEYLESQDVTLGREETKTIAFNLTPNQAGSYQIAVDGVSHTLVVTEAEEPTPEATPPE